MKRRPIFLAPIALTVAATRCGGCDPAEFGRLQGDLVLHPSPLVFETTPVLVPARAVLTLENQGEAPVRIERWTLSTPDGAHVALGEGDLARPSGAQSISDPTRSVDSILPRVVAPSEALSIPVVAWGEAARAYTATLTAALADDGPLVSVRMELFVEAQPDCDDENACTRDWYSVEDARCHHAFDDGRACIAADRCIINAVCSAGVCIGETKTCTDESDCTRDLCRQSDGVCRHIEDASLCDDQNPCTTDLCGPDGCLNEPLPRGTQCDDGDPCTVDDACIFEICQGRALADGLSCDDGDSCTTADICVNGACTGSSILSQHAEGEIIFRYPLRDWPYQAFLHRRELSLSSGGILYGLDHLNRVDPQSGALLGLTHEVFAMKDCGSPVYSFDYQPPDALVLVAFVRRAMQLNKERLRIAVGVRQREEDGYRPQTTTYILDEDGNVITSEIQALGMETGRSLLPDGSHIYGLVWPRTMGRPTPEQPAEQDLLIVREDREGAPLWTHQRYAWDWAEFLGVAGPRVLFWSAGQFGALDFNTGATVWTQPTAFITKEMALVTEHNLGVARAGLQIIGVEILEGRPVFTYPDPANVLYVPRTDPVISSDGRILFLMQHNDPNGSDLPTELEWVELALDGTLLARTRLPYSFPPDPRQARGWVEDDPYPTVADDGTAYLGYGDRFFALNPGGEVRWTLTSTDPSAFTGTVPLLRDDGVLLISHGDREILGVRTNGGTMATAGWASFRHDGARTNHTP